MGPVAVDTSEIDAVAPAPAPAPVASSPPSPSVEALAVVVAHLVSSRLETERAPRAPALRLAGAARPLRRGLASCEWLRRTAATIHLQRCMRGHAARNGARELVTRQEQLVKDFLSSHGEQWQRTPGAADLQACGLHARSTACTACGACGHASTMRERFYVYWPTTAPVLAR